MKIESGAIDLSLFEFKLSPLYNKSIFTKTELIETTSIRLQTKHYFTKYSHLNTGIRICRFHWIVQFKNLNA